MQNAIVNVNGEILKEPDTACISVFDRSFMYGDSLYEVIRTYNGRFLHLNEHLIRLGKSSELCQMKFSHSLSHYAQECEKSLAAFQRLPGMKNEEAYCRIILSRGKGKIGFGTQNVVSPTLYAVIVQPLNPPTQEQWEKGFQFQVVKRLRNDRRALDPAMKSGNYLNSLLGFLEATREGYDDALLCNGEGFLTEGTTFNIFYVRRGIIATPPLDVGILDGITRRHVMHIARSMGFEVREVLFPKERLYEADEVFMTSTIKEVFPVAKVDAVRINGGKPGPITRELAEAFREDVRTLIQGKASGGQPKSEAKASGF